MEPTNNQICRPSSFSAEQEVLKNNFDLNDIALSNINALGPHPFARLAEARENAIVTEYSWTLRKQTGQATDITTSSSPNNLQILGETEFKPSR